jgi:hypothetical protein
VLPTVVGGVADGAAGVETAAVAAPTRAVNPTARARRGPIITPHVRGADRWKELRTARFVVSGTTSTG